MWYDIACDIIYDTMSWYPRGFNAAFDRPCSGRASLRRYNMLYENINQKKILFLDRRDGAGTRILVFPEAMQTPSQLTQ